jgi:hypothetical protein
MAMTDYSNEIYEIKTAIHDAVDRLTAPHVLYKPAISLDGDKWCALLGDNLQIGVAGFGDTPAEAMAEFDKAWVTLKSPKPRTK